MVLRAMYSGVSGLRAEGEALGVVGDNIANVNTTGFKAQRALFEDVLGHSILAGTSSSMPGSGVKVGDIQQMFTQGTLQNTGVSTDVALNGDGFFVVKGTVDGLSSDFYTRAGTFTINRDGYLTNPAGLKVQGYETTGNGTFAASMSDVKAPTAALKAEDTSNVKVTANLDADNTTTPPLAVPWDNQNPSKTSNFSTTMTVYDSLGAAHTMDIYFRKQDPAVPPGAVNSWDYHVVVKGDDVAGGTAGQNYELPGGLTPPAATGTLTFNDKGGLDAVTGTAITVDFNNAAPAQAITLDFGTPAAGVAGLGFDGTTQFAGASNVSSQSQDGYASGDFSGVAIDGTGVVQGLYTNGQKIDMAQLTIAKFRSNDGLGRAGQNLWIETRESGNAAMGTAGSGGRGATSAGALEGSNVDLAEEFVGLIQHQRSFSANSKTITTADEMLQELINIKR